MCCVFLLCKWADHHLSLQHVSLQAGAILLSAVGPADRQAVRLPLLFGLAGGGTAPALHRHPSFQTWCNYSLKVQKRTKKNHRKEGDEVSRKLFLVGNIRWLCCTWQWLNVWSDKVSECEKELLSIKAQQVLHGNLKMKYEELLGQKFRC